jgi:hypothetical protein
MAPFKGRTVYGNSTARDGSLALLLNPGFGQSGRTGVIFACTVRPSLGRQFVLPFMHLTHTAAAVFHTFFFVFILISAGTIAPFAAAQAIKMSVDTSKAGVKIDRNIFGQFAEHLGHGIYEGIWVGARLDNPQYPRHPKRCSYGS